MADDLKDDEPGDKDAKKASGQILREEIDEGLQTAVGSTEQLFFSGLSAGLDVGFSVFLMGVMTTVVHHHLPEPVQAILIANMYSLGFIFVVLGRSELFTEQTTLAVLPVLSGENNLRSLGRLWAIVYTANLIGGAAFAYLTALIGPSLGAIDVSALGAIAHRMTDHSGRVIFAGAVMAGWLMGLLSWLVTAARDTISQIVIVWLITFAIGFSGFQHVVLGTVEVLSGLFAHQGIGIASFGRFVLYATLGNAFGGAFFVALIKYGHARHEKDEA